MSEYTLKSEVLFYEYAGTGNRTHDTVSHQGSSVAQIVMDAGLYVKVVRPKMKQCVVG